MRLGWGVAALAAAAGALSSCTPTPTESPSSSVSPSPTAVASAAPGRAPGDLDLAAVQEILSGLPTEPGFEWEGGRSTTSPASSQFVWSDYRGEPQQCAPLDHLRRLEFEDDREVAPSDVIVSTSLVRVEGTQPGEWEGLGSVDVRILDDPPRGMEAVYRIEAALEYCEDGFAVALRGDAFDRRTDSVETLFLPQDEERVDAAIALVGDMSGAFTVPRTVWAWIATDNLLIHVGYEINPEVPESSIEGGEAFVEAVIAAFAPAN